MKVSKKLGREIADALLWRDVSDSMIRDILSKTPFNQEKYSRYLEQRNEAEKQLRDIGIPIA